MTNPKADPEIEPYDGPEGGYGSLEGVAAILLHEQVPQRGVTTLNHQNKPDGFQCVSARGPSPPSRNRSNIARTEPRLPHRRRRASGPN